MACSRLKPRTGALAQFGAAAFRTASGSDAARGGGLEPMRLQDAWLHQKLEVVRRVAATQRLAVLQVLYGRVLFTFQTLNFPIGRVQHFRSDAVHFNSLLNWFMCRAWVELEDFSAVSGPLV